MRWFPTQHGYLRAQKPKNRSSSRLAQGVRCGRCSRSLLGSKHACAALVLRHDSPSHLCTAGALTHRPTRLVSRAWTYQGFSSSGAEGATQQSGSRLPDFWLAGPALSPPPSPPPLSPPQPAATKPGTARPLRAKPGLFLCATPPGLFFRLLAGWSRTSCVRHHQVFSLDFWLAGPAVPMCDTTRSFL